MRSRVKTILKLALCLLIGGGLGSCDSRLNIEEPTTFLKYIGEDGDQTAVDMVVDEEGNIYILGTSGLTASSTQTYIVKTNAAGFVQWSQSYGNPGEDIPKDIELLDNGNLAVVADKVIGSPPARDMVVYLVSNVDGALLASPTIADEFERTEYATSISQTNNGFVITSYYDTTNQGSPYKQGLVRRFNSDLQEYNTGSGPGGGFFWYPKLDQAAADIVPVKAIQVFLTDPGSGLEVEKFYFFGYTNSFLDGVNEADYNFFVFVNNSQGENENALILTSADPNSNERLTDVQYFVGERGSEGFALSGYISSPGSAEQSLFVAQVKYNLLGIQNPSNIGSWTYNTGKTVATSLSSNADSPASVFPSPNSGFLILGEENTVGNNNLYLTKVNYDLDAVWPDPYAAHIFGGIGNDEAAAVAQAGDGSILVCGTMTLGEVNGQLKIVLMKLSPEGMFGD